MSKKNILAHDVGTGGDKAVITDLTGQVLATAFSEYGVNYPQPGWAEQEIEVIWSAIAQTTRRVMDRARVPPDEIAGVALSAQMFNCLPVSESGAPLCPMISWLDQRAVRQADHILEHPGASFFFEHTANVPSAKDVIPKILWLREQRPDIWARTYKLLDCKEYLLQRLTGNNAIDFHGASVFFLFDPKKKAWSLPVSDALNIPIEMLPEAYPCTEVIGEVTQSAARQTGLAAGTPVVICAGDVATAQIGSGALSPGIADLSIGTATWVGVTSDTIVNHPDKPLWFLSHVDDDYWILAGEMETGGGALRWFRDTLLSEQSAGAKDGMPSSYALINQMAASVPPGADNLLFLPWLSGERNPVPDHYARGGFIGLGLGHTRAHMARAVLEGVAFHIRWIVETIQALEVPLKTLNAIGGGATSDIWLQIIADITGLEIRVVKWAQEAGAVGAALTCAIGLGLYPDVASLESVIQFSHTVQPIHDQRQARYESLFRIYIDLFEALRPFNKALYPNSKF